MGKEALSGLKVLEYSEFISGPYCGKLLADLGAEVIKIEKPGFGDKSRSHGPFPKDIPHPEKSGLFLYLNTNKLGITLNVRGAAGMKIFGELARWADVIVENNSPREMEKLGLDYESIHKINPSLVMTSITPFGQTGPYRDYKACDLITFHASGEAYLNPAEGVEDIEQLSPLKGPAHVGEFMAGLAAAASTMSAVIARQLTGEGQHVDLSAQEALASITRRDFGIFTYEGIPCTRLRADRTNYRGIYPCKDGYISATSNNDNFFASFVEMMGNPDWSKSELCKDEYSRRTNADFIWLMAAEWTRERTVKEVMQAAEGLRFPIMPVNTIEAVLNSELASARDMLAEVDHKEAGLFKYPGAPYKLSGTPWRLKRPAPLLGEHNEEVYCRMLGHNKQDLVKMRQAGVI
jgi:CoA:oxalate CoA-transferase